MNIYLPIAEQSVNALLIIGLGGIVAARRLNADPFAIMAYAMATGWLLFLIGRALRHGLADGGHLPGGGGEAGRGSVHRWLSG